MKKILVLVAALCVFHFSNAQFLTFAFRAGVSSSGLQVAESFPVSGGSVSYKDGSKILGWHVGFLARVGISKFYVQPELLFVQSGGNIEVTSSSSNPAIFSGKKVGKITFSTISVPVLAGLKLGKIMHINAGPAFNYVLSQKVSDNIKDLDQKYKKGNDWLPGRNWRRHCTFNDRSEI